MSEGRSSWSEAIDPTTGKVYYYNTDLRKSTWKKPKEMESFSRTMPSSEEFKKMMLARTTSVSSAPTTPASKSGSAPSLEKPKAVRSVSSADLSWVKVLDSSSGRYYYANMSTGTTTWEAPAEVKTSEELKHDAIPEMSNLIALAPDFFPKAGCDEFGDIYDEIFDLEKSKYYYYNRKTRESFWEKPSGWRYLEGEDAAGIEIAIDEKIKKKREQREKMITRSASVTLESKSDKSSSKVPKKSLFGSKKLFQKATTVDDTGLPSTIKDDIQKFKVEGFAEEHFRKHKKRQGLFKRSLPVGDILAFQKEPITTSLLKISKDSSAAISTFKTILRFMGLMTGDSAKTDTVLVKSLVEVGVNKPEMRDEIYCQLCKQTHQNPDLISNIQAWKLFIMCACNFPPTRGFESFLFSYMSRACHGPPEVTSLIVFCIWRLHRTIRSGPMKTPLSLSGVEEIVKEKGGIPYKYVSFGSSLNLLMKCQENAGIDSTVPVILENLTSACLATGALKTVGLFRRTGDRSSIDAVIGGIENGNLEIKESDPLVVADCLKIWLRELHPKIFSSALTKKAVEISDKPALYDQVLGALDPYQMAVLDHIMRFCAEVSRNVIATSMGPENLGIVLAPNLFTDDSDDPSTLLHGSNARIVFVSNLVRMWEAKTD